MTEITEPQSNESQAPQREIDRPIEHEMKKS